jgi:hypothetical protein
MALTLMLTFLHYKKSCLAEWWVGAGATSIFLPGAGLRYNFTHLPILNIKFIAVAVEALWFRPPLYYNNAAPAPQLPIAISFLCQTAYGQLTYRFVEK